jgi:hypothetical protein
MPGGRARNMKIDFLRSRLRAETSHSGVRARTRDILTVAEKVIFRGLLKNAQMQVELREIPLTGAPEILRPKEMSIEAYLDARRNKPAPCLTRGRIRKRSRWAFFSSLLITSMGFP